MNIKYQSSYDWLEKRVTQGGGGGGEHNKQDKRGGGRQIAEDPDLKLLSAQEAELFSSGVNGNLKKKEIKSKR